MQPNTKRLKIVLNWMSNKGCMYYVSTLGTGQKPTKYAAFSNYEKKVKN